MKVCIVNRVQEERKRYVVASVNDPRDDNNKLTLEQATNDGIVHYASGKYVNPDTGEGENIASDHRSLWYLAVSCEIRNLWSACIDRFTEIDEENRIWF